MQEGYCFAGDETQGNVDAIEFTTMICAFIANLPLEKDNEVILFSDGCGYQNRNSTLANGLFNLAQLLDVTITQKYLEKGHPLLLKIICDILILLFLVVMLQ